MTTLMKVRLVIAGVAAVVWGYGYKVDDARVRLTGIVLLLATLLLRFLPASRARDDPPAS